MRLKHAMMTTNGQSAADRYAARVDAVLAQRTRLRGPQPPGDQRAGCPADNPLVKADPLRPLDPNLAVIASYIEADDVIIDVGGGAGRISLPLALRCREVINVEPSPTMRMGFGKNAAGAGISNARIIEGEWPSVDAPVGSVALVNHVTYLTREIVPFIKKLEQAGRRRIRMPAPRDPGGALRRTLYRRPRGLHPAVYYTRPRNSDHLAASGQEPSPLARISHSGSGFDQRCWPCDVPETG
jgi:hypothetical protein